MFIITIMYYFETKISRNLNFCEIAQIFYFCELETAFFSLRYLNKNVLDSRTVPDDTQEQL
jgi:hypothetical protein